MLAAPVVGLLQHARQWVRSRAVGMGRPPTAHEQRRLPTAAGVAAEELRLERDRLRVLLGLKEQNPAGSITAEVTAHHPHTAMQTLLIDRGSQDGVVKGMIALQEGGLVGRVERVANHHATVLLLTDPNHAVDVWTQRSRVRGLLVGRGGVAQFQRTVGVTRLEYLEEGMDILPGDVVVTTGLEGRYPKGVPVGTVQTVERGEFGSALEAKVLPFVDWQAIEELLLVHPTP